MSDNIKHRCPSCGGSLTVDNDRQMYYCKYCESTFDYEYFREEEMHEMGETYLLRGEFIAAIEAYKFILKKNPHDFSALRGLMLAAARLKNMDELVNVRKTGFKYDTELVSEVIKSASEKDRKYFTDWEKIYSDMKRRSDCKAEVETLEANKRSVKAEAEMKSEKCHAYYYKGKHGREISPKEMFITMWILGFIFTVSAILFFTLFITQPAPSDAEIYAIENRNMAIGFSLPLALMGLGCIIWNFVGVYHKLQMVNLIKNHIGKLNAEAAEMEYKIMQLNSKSDTLSDKISDSGFDFVNKDRLIMNMNN